MDNCEHLVTAVARLADRVLAACPQVRIMATSREPLNITGEALWTVGPLTLPPDPAVSSFDSAERAGLPAPATVTSLDASAAVRLLAQRARAVSPGFEVTAANAPAVGPSARSGAGSRSSPAVPPWRRPSRSALVVPSARTRSSTC